MLFVIMGPSGSGKTAITELLREKYGKTVVESYTTRPRRYPNERGHIFVSDDEFARLKDKVAEVSYAGAQYCATLEQLRNSDLYVAEPSALDDLRRLKDHGKLDYLVVAIEVEEPVRKTRMRVRGDTSESIQQRIQWDRVVFSDMRKISDKVIYNDFDLEYATDRLFEYMRTQSQKSDKE